jgi:uncharacterized protein (TIGR00156 family)
MKYILLLAVMLLGTQTTVAQYTGPSSGANRGMTISEVLKNARILQLRDNHVQLRGFVVEHIREDYYLFRDDSGEIWIEIYGDVMPTWPFDESTEIVLTGEVDFDVFRGTYIWVQRIQKANEATPRR